MFCLSLIHIFAQVAKIHHQDDLVNLALLFGLFVQRTQHDNITLQADVTQLHLSLIHIFIVIGIAVMGVFDI